jgi:hypothetical protein
MKATPKKEKKETQKKMPVGSWQPTNIFQFKISIKYLTPKIWRRFLVTDDITFNRLHLIIQDVMGWENYHLFSFKDRDFIIEIKEKENEMMNIFGSLNRKPVFEAKKTQICQIFNTPKQKMIYTYDFGDNWEHELVLEKILEYDREIKYPVCLAGKYNCPPEDCGGAPGFYEMVQAFSDKNHPEHDDVVEWLGEDYDPFYFSAEETTSLLKSHIGKNK